jgi:cobalt/nickel transport system permease protein
MHIADGILSMPVLATGTAATLTGTAFGLKFLRNEDIPRAALMSSAFFAVSLIHVPVGLGSAHLLLGGLIGLTMGLSSFPVILVALLLQAVMFGHGGICALGVNTFNMAFPALLCYLIFSRMIRNVNSRQMIFFYGFLVGAAAIAMSCLLAALSLYFSSRAFLSAAVLLFCANAPLMLIEGVITGFAAVFVKKVSPEIFDVSLRLEEEAA